MNFGSRLEEQRKAVGLSQAEIAERCGVSREMWGKYERDAAVPGGEVLAKAVSAGLDVLYILTGRGAEAASDAPVVAPEHAALLDNYAHCAPDDQAAIRRLAATASKSPASKRRRSG